MRNGWRASKGRLTLNLKRCIQTGEALEIAEMKEMAESG